MYHDQINGDSSLKNYESNAMLQFSKHYEKIEKYKNRIRQLGISNDNSEVQVVFLMEDKSPLGTLVHDGTKTHAVNLAHNRNFLEFYMEKPNVDYVLNCFCAFNQSLVWIIPHSQLREYEEDILQYEKMQFISSTPQVIGFTTLIPKTEYD